jgi:hypothetical protein
MALNSFSNIGNSMELDGKFHYQYMYKAALPAAGTAGYFVDSSMAAGQPKYNAYAGGELSSNVLTGAGNFGIYPGSFITGSSKHLLRWQCYSGAYVSTYFHLCDYLLFYPLVDCDNTDPQPLTNTEVLTRYTDGVGVRIMLVATAPMIATAPCTITYTNSDGVSGRTATFNVIPALATGAANTASLFVNLAAGDKGVRSVDQIQFAGSAGGFISIVLVKPLATNQLLEATVPTEKMFGFEYQNLPEIKPGAYLNIVFQASQTGASNLLGEFIFINS